MAMLTMTMRSLLRAASRPTVLSWSAGMFATALGSSLASRFATTMPGSDRNSRTMAYVYSGPGASSKGVSAIVSLLRSALTTKGVQTLELQDILPPTDSNQVTPLASSTELPASAPPHWTDNGAVLIMPGGHDYTHYLNRAQVQAIRNFVSDGGSFLGMCAGAYFGASRCIFEGRQVATSSQRLGFFPGDAVGSITPQPYDPSSEIGAASVEVVWNPAFVNRCKAAGEPTPDQKPLHVAFSPVSLNVYANGGCCFVHPNPQDFEVLAVYGDDQGLRQDSEGRAAIASCHYGKGKVVLSGVHPEFTAQDARSGAQACHCVNGASSLQEEDDWYRAALFRSLLREAGVNLGDKDKTVYYNSIPANVFSAEDIEEAARRSIQMNQNKQ